MSERNMTNNVGKSTVQASNAASNTHTRPNSCFKVSDVLSLSFGVSCRRVRVVLPNQIVRCLHGAYRARTAGIVLPAPPNRNT